MDNQMLNMEEMEQVAGGNIFTDAWDWFCDKITYGESTAADDHIHENCGGHITCEDHGTYHPDVHLTCQQCGKTWHPHSYSRIKEFDDVRPA